MMDTKRARDGSARVAGGQSLPRLRLLVVGKLRSASHPNTTFPGSQPALVGALQDAVALVFRQSTQESNKPPNLRIFCAPELLTSASRKCKNCEGKGTLKKGDKVVRCQRCDGTGIKR